MSRKKRDQGTVHVKKFRKGFRINVVAYVIVNIALWVVFSFAFKGGYPWPVLTTFGWGLVVIAHYFDIKAKLYDVDRNKNEG